MPAAREGELTYYDHDGWAWPATWRTTVDWVIVTRGEDGARMYFDRAQLAGVVSLTDGAHTQTTA